MIKLPRISGRECVRGLEKAGFLFKRQQGSHIILRRNDPFSQIVVPDHKELDRGTLFPGHFVLMSRANGPPSEQSERSSLLSLMRFEFV
jgi:predicted RNA binding protein YcfA (HicA-like mRNA interferase family)